MRVQFARQVLGQRSPGGLVRRSSPGRCCASAFCLTRLQFFELEFQLLDLARDLSLFVPNIMRRSRAMTSFRCSISLSRLSSFSCCALNSLCCAAISASSAARSSVLRSAIRASAIARSMPRICNSDRSKSCNLSCRLWFPCSLRLAPVNAFQKHR